MKTLYSTVQQCESILDPDQNKVMNRMTDEMIRSRIREYCTYKRHNACWLAANPALKITTIDKDEKGWYVDTESEYHIKLMENSTKKSFQEYCISHVQKIDKQKGFLVMDPGDPVVYFRWRKHKGCLAISDSLDLESTEGLPEELDVLELDRCCYTNQRFTVHNKIKWIVLINIWKLHILGNGYKNVLTHFNNSIADIKTSNQVKIYYPENMDEYWDLRKKLK